jgi:hypothetical protein
MSTRLGIRRKRIICHNTSCVQSRHVCVSFTEPRLNLNTLLIIYVHFYPPVGLVAK